MDALPTQDRVWTQQSISAWAARVFGHSDRSPMGIATRGNIEAVELLQVLLNPVPGKGRIAEQVAMECADVYIVLCQVADKLGFGMTVWTPGQHRLNHTGLVGLAAELLVHLADLLSLLQHNALEPTPSATDEAQRLLSEIHVRLDILCARMDHDLLDVVHEKMEINYKRQWQKLPSGRMQHT